MSSSLIKLTELPARSAFFIDPAAIFLITKSDKNLLETLIVTYQPGPQGTKLTYAVLESLEEVARLANAGRLGKDLSIN